MTRPRIPTLARRFAYLLRHGPSTIAELRSLGNSIGTRDQQIEAAELAREHGIVVLVLDPDGVERYHLTRWLRDYPEHYRNARIVALENQKETA